MAVSAQTPLPNRLLARLPRSDYERLVAQMQPVALKLRQVLYKSFAPIDYVYFPTGGIISTMAIMSDGTAIEVATIGNEGMAGLTAAYSGAEATSPNEVMVQVEGQALRLPAETLGREARTDGPLRHVLALYTSVFGTQVSYSVACNGLHKVEQRCCRWLLMTADRVGSNELQLTHEFLAVMLGVQRSSLTEVLQPLQQRELLRSERGKITILNRPGVEATACECYRRVQDEYARLLG